MKYVGKIQWHEGLFLRPQHFQQNDLFLQQSLHLLANANNPWYWGIEALRIATSRVSTQVFEIENLVVTFQDGTRVSFPDHAVLLPRSFENAWGANATRLPVYLGLRNVLEGAENISKPNEAGSGDLTSKLQQRRYVESSTQKKVADHFSADSGEPIATLIYNLQLFFGNEYDDAADFTKIKIAEVIRSGTDIRLAEDYIPPIATQSASPVFQKWLRELRDMLTSKSRELELHKKDRINDSAMGLREVFYLLSLRILNGFVPVFHHRIESMHGSPAMIYESLVHLAGELSTLSFKYDLFGEYKEGGEAPLPSYDHQAISACFRKVLRVIHAIIDEITAGPDLVARMLFDGTYFYTEVNTRALQGNNRYYLHVQTDLDAGQISTLMGVYAKMASRELLPILVARSLAGIPLEYVGSPPSILPRTQRSHYFEIAAHSDAWTSVKEMQNIAVYLDSPPADTEIDLMVIYDQ